MCLFCLFIYSFIYLFILFIFVFILFLYIYIYICIYMYINIKYPTLSNWISLATHLVPPLGTEPLSILSAMPQEITAERLWKDSPHG